jgi:hypothetical protein
MSKNFKFNRNLYLKTKRVLLLVHTVDIVILFTVILTSIHTERLFAFPLQQWLRERTVILRYTYNIWAWGSVVVKALRY